MQIVHHSAGVLGIQAEEDGVREIARRSRGTPRIVNRLLKRVRDYADVNGDGIIDTVTTTKALELLEIDELGLDPADRNLLSSIIENYGNNGAGPVWWYPMEKMYSDSNKPSDKELLKMKNLLLNELEKLI